MKGAVRSRAREWGWGWSRLGSRGEGAARECMGGSRGYNGVYTCEKLCARSSGMLFICVVIGLECRLGGGAG